MPAVKSVSLGEFLSRHNGIKPRIAKTNDHNEDEWCFVAPDPANRTIYQLSKRINSLEGMAQTLLNRINALEASSRGTSKPVSSSSSLSNELKRVRLRASKSNAMGISANSLKNALILQKQKILAEKRASSIAPRVKQKRNSFQQELLRRVKNPMLKEAWHVLKPRKLEDSHTVAMRTLRQAIMIKKAQLKRVPSPHCQTVIVLD